MYQTSNGLISRKLSVFTASWSSPEAWIKIPTTNWQMSSSVCKRSENFPDDLYIYILNKL